jgi:NAD(P)-dependent dehydrogenase (short-subunit alcohol dehydrogenase family)
VRKALDQAVVLVVGAEGPIGAAAVRALADAGAAVAFVARPGGVLGAVAAVAGGGAEEWWITVTGADSPPGGVSYRLTKSRIRGIDRVCADTGCVEAARGGRIDVVCPADVAGAVSYAVTRAAVDRLLVRADAPRSRPLLRVGGG